MSQNGTSSKKSLFGQVAINKGYVTDLQVQDALYQQNDLGERGEKHKLIGMVMLEMGVLGTTELIEILRAMDIAYPNLSS